MALAADKNDKDKVGDTREKVRQLRNEKKYLKQVVEKAAICQRRDQKALDKIDSPRLASSAGFPYPAPTYPTGCANRSTHGR